MYDGINKMNQTEDTDDSTNAFYDNNTTECDYVAVPIDIRHPWIAKLYMVGFSAIIFIGLPANVLSFLVLRKDRPQSTTRTLLIYLAISDVFILLFNFMLYPLKTIYDVYNPVWLAWALYGDPHFYALTNVAKFAQIWITVFISADRYFAVCHPTRALAIRTVQNARRAGLLIVIGALVFNIPRYFSYHRVPVYCAQYNRTIFKSVHSNHFNDFEVVFESVLDPVIYFYVPIVALVVFNILLIRSVRKANAKRQEMKMRVKNDAGLTLTLIAVVTTFIVCETPTLASLLLDLCFQITERTIGRQVARHSFCALVLEDETLLSISILMVLINSSTNFFLYVIMVEKFRFIFFEHVLDPFRRKISSPL